MNSYHVVLVVDREFGARLCELQEGTPVWIVDSPANHPAIVVARESRKEKNHLTGVTSFRDFPRLSAASLAAGMIRSIELHHGSDSHQPPFSRLTVIGSPVDSSLTEILEEIGFQLVSASDSMMEFLAKEKPDEPL